MIFVGPSLCSVRTANEDRMIPRLPCFLAAANLFVGKGRLFHAIRGSQRPKVMEYLF